MLFKKVWVNPQQEVRSLLSKSPRRVIDTYIYMYTLW